jgi:hypothetical protein
MAHRKRKPWHAMPADEVALMRAARGLAIDMATYVQVVCERAMVAGD